MESRAFECELFRFSSRKSRFFSPRVIVRTATENHFSAGQMIKHYKTLISRCVVEAGALLPLWKVYSADNVYIDI